MPYVLDHLARASNIVVLPHCLELWAEPAEFRDQRFHLRRRSRACRVNPERARHFARYAGFSAKTDRIDAKMLAE